jgi:hypothetical protein
MVKEKVKNPCTSRDWCTRSRAAMIAVQNKPKKAALHACTEGTTTISIAFSSSLSSSSCQSTQTRSRLTSSNNSDNNNNEKKENDDDHVTNAPQQQ